MLASLVVPALLAFLLIGLIPLRQRPLDMRQGPAGLVGILVIMAVMLLIIGSL